MVVGNGVALIVGGGRASFEVVGGGLTASKVVGRGLTASKVVGRGLTASKVVGGMVLVEDLKNFMGWRVAQG